MILGYLLVGMMAGLAAFLAALTTGASVWSALLLYSLVGSIGVIAVPLVRFTLGELDDDPRRSAHEEEAAAKTSSPSCNSLSDEVNLEEADDPLLSAQVEDGSASPMKILAVDDDPSILELIPLISATAGFFEVTAVSSGKRALETLKSAEEDFACLLLDINMPEMDGIELCARVRQLPSYRETPIIMLTAMRDMKYIDRAFLAGATDYLTKPFDITDFSRRLQFAQEAVLVQRRSAAVTRTADKGSVVEVPNKSIPLSDNIRFEGVEGLADYAAFCNYLTQLPRDQLPDTQIVAIRIDQIVSIYNNASVERFNCILRNFAAAILEKFNIKLMAYNNEGILLAIFEAGQLTSSNMEEDVRNALTSALAEGDNAEFLPIDVSIGDPVTPVAAKIQRSKITCDRAIMRADTRYLQKHDRLIIG